ncbi:MULTISPECIES: hypothetical protein [Flavobacterium]|uniref:hypothetical protein n=1 Tax=Flavobacterium TaxID=237 RepID=UPI000745E089|nr:MULTISPECIES: hypothetical protein [Flavobacterium]OXA83367.1 hypothetical protein B0A56_01805 [Flavobacterium columnare NBRC 100251 = ATCC 23463]AMA50449.1 hypothetical protein AWN65_13765 [Flavobacterium covae]AND64029.1 hypothetical protein AX766_06160 [Flavobacterium covae]MCJ1805693.1 hypothetical protein [Flavobacterium covae]MCJ1809074.1 hypothetical protein [Flavobacterium covae]
MKNTLNLLLFVIILISCGSNRSISQIDQKLNHTKGKEIVLQKVLNDSRCPEGVQCIWEGEVVIQVAYFENGQIKEEKQFTLRSNDQEEIIEWFRLHLPKSKKTLQTVSVLPLRKKKERQILPIEYSIILGY